jgi:hypothetical protein
MARRPLRWLVVSYPKAWRAEHGPELSALVDELVEDGASRLGIAVDLIKGGLGVRWRSLKPSEVLLAGCAVVLLTLGVAYGAQFATSPHEGPAAAAHGATHAVKSVPRGASTPVTPPSSPPNVVVSSSSPSCQTTSFSSGALRGDSTPPLAVVSLCKEPS